MMNTWPIPSLLHFGTSPIGRWKLWAFFATILLVATVGTWIAGQYQIGRLDSVKKRYDQPVQNFAKMMADSPPHSVERDLLESCKQSQIGTWLQTTDALRFEGPLTGNRIDVRLDSERAYLDLNGKEMSECVQDEVEDRQFDIGSMTGTWSVILLFISFCMGLWSWICFVATRKAQTARNIYAETLAMTNEQSTATPPEPATSVESGNTDSSDKESPDKTVE